MALGLIARTRETACALETFCGIVNRAVTPGNRPSRRVDTTPKPSCRNLSSSASVRSRDREFGTLVIVVVVFIFVVRDGGETLQRHTGRQRYHAGEWRVEHQERQSERYGADRWAHGRWLPG